MKLHTPKMKLNKTLYNKNKILCGSQLLFRTFLGGALCICSLGIHKNPYTSSHKTIMIVSYSCQIDTNQGNIISDFCNQSMHKCTNLHTSHRNELTCIYQRFCMNTASFKFKIVYCFLSTQFYNAIRTLCSYAVIKILSILHFYITLVHWQFLSVWPHWGLVTHGCVSELDSHWLWQWLVSDKGPSHYLDENWSFSGVSIESIIR